MSNIPRQTDSIQLIKTSQRHFFLWKLKKFQDEVEEPLQIHKVDSYSPCGFKGSVKFTLNYFTSGIVNCVTFGQGRFPIKLPGEEKSKEHS